MTKKRNSLVWTQEQLDEYRDRMAGNGKTTFAGSAVIPPPPAAPGHRSAAQSARGMGVAKRATARDGSTFDSKMERDYYEWLLEDQRDPAKSLAWFLRQVPFRLPGGVIYRLDFLEFHIHEDWVEDSDGDETLRVRAVDTKGWETEMFRTKKKLVESLYPIEIELVKTVPKFPA